jgi:hypothetical protein
MVSEQSNSGKIPWLKSANKNREILAMFPWFRRAFLNRELLPIALSYNHPTTTEKYLPYSVIPWLSDSKGIVEQM